MFTAMEHTEGEKSVVEDRSTQRTVQINRERGVLLDCGVAAGVDVSFNYLSNEATLRNKTWRFLLFLTGTISALC